MNQQTTEEKKKEAIEFLIREIGADFNSAKELLILSRSIEYAGIEKWISHPLSREEEALKKIFIIRATSYFRRKCLHPFNDIEKIKYIENHEHIECDALRSIYTPFIKTRLQ